MPKIDDIKSKKPFTKKEYRPYGNVAEQVGSDLSSRISQKALIENEQSTSSFPIVETIIEIDPTLIINWENNDRPKNELGDIDAFAKELLDIGQQVPCIVRKKNEKYELIAGERRWRAAIKANLLLKVNVKNLTDLEAAICQIAENTNRKDLSDYAKGMSYARLIEKQIIKQSDLINKLGMSKQQISRLLSFKDIPLELIEAIGDLTRVSARTAEEIRLLCNKDQNNLHALISIADKIASGIGSTTLQKEVKRKLEKEVLFTSTEKVISKSGRHLFSWRKDGNGNKSISFPKDVRTHVNYKKIEQTLAEAIQIQLGELQ